MTVTPPSLRVGHSQAGDPAGKHEPAPSMVCSARRCGCEAQWILRWNNPALHTPERRKIWLACGEHVDGLTEFLSSRGFLRETAPASDPTLRLPV